MQCPYLVGTTILSCALEKAVYIPSLFELEEYCKTSRHIKCPLTYGKVPGNDVFTSLSNLKKYVTK